MCDQKDVEEKNQRHESIIAHSPIDQNSVIP